jgi:hypothetical protein
MIAAARAPGSLRNIFLIEERIVFTPRDGVFPDLLRLSFKNPARELSESRNAPYEAKKTKKPFRLRVTLATDVDRENPREADLICRNGVISR